MRWPAILILSLFAAVTAAFVVLWFLNPPAKVYHPSQYTGGPRLQPTQMKGNMVTDADLTTWQRVLAAPSPVVGLYPEYPLSTNPGFKNMAVTVSNAQLLVYQTAARQTSAATALALAFVAVAERYGYTEGQWDQGSTSGATLFWPHYSTHTGRKYLYRDTLWVLQSGEVGTNPPDLGTPDADGNFSQIGPDGTKLKVGDNYVLYEQRDDMADTDHSAVDMYPNLMTSAWVGLGLVAYVEDVGVGTGPGLKAARLACALWRACAVGCRTVGVSVTSPLKGAATLITAYKHSDQSYRGLSPQRTVSTDTSEAVFTDENVLFNIFTQRVALLSVFPNAWRTTSPTPAEVKQDVDGFVLALTHEPTRADYCITESQISTPEELNGAGVFADPVYKVNATTGAGEGGFSWWYTGLGRCVRGSVLTSCGVISADMPIAPAADTPWKVNCWTLPPNHIPAFLYLQEEDPTQNLRLSLEYMTARQRVADADVGPTGCSKWSESSQRCTPDKIPAPKIRWGMSYSPTADGVDVPTSAKFAMALYKMGATDQGSDTMNRAFNSLLEGLVKQLRVNGTANKMMYGSYRAFYTLPFQSTNTAYRVWRHGFVPCLAGHVWGGLAMQYVHSNRARTFNPLRMVN
jgi:hypothetical protein